MNRDEAKQLLPIIKAFSEGKVIQCVKSNGEWIDMDNPDVENMCDALKYYRIKPIPKYRPFKDAEECWNEMLKHQPVGWLKDKDSDKHYILLTYIDGNNIGLNGNNEWNLVDIMACYTFFDGAPFGIKEESEG